MKSVYIIRHGSTKLNHEDKLRGWSDVPLSDKGKEEVRATARKLKDSGIQIIISSDLTRAQETAHEISKETGAPVKTTMGLRPWNVGIFTGQDSKDTHPKLKEYATKPNVSIPKGESFNSFKNRFIDELEDVLKKYKDKEIALVTHHRGERLIKSWIKAGQPEDRELDMSVFFLHGEPPAHAEVVKLADKADDYKSRALIKKQ